MRQHPPIGMYNGVFYGVRLYGVMVGSSEFNEASSPRDALLVLHQADTSITNKQKEAVQELLGIHVDFLVGNELSRAWTTVRSATGIPVARLNKGGRVHERMQTAKRTKTGSTTATKKSIHERTEFNQGEKKYKATLVEAINENLAFMSNTVLRDSVAETMRLIAGQEAKAEKSEEDIDSFEESVSEESDIPDDEFDHDESENHDSEGNVSRESSAEEK
ncbi:uncharacterized protein CYBJADRAFT_165906 [Cyberlindnera jadinii NRRL Y-1542]|uniref:Uncharacterized protein n=1 Tax=Cyberlindnera jadinii (strain ATCC 18201 / CBS 1600 / BCRC 20928 / JCM 3617 / NBRC 0987 / NRRL Y-1542) TaxID=983966 RepID=A0A1E4S6R6_CYBJN|nr:hypothetical protein CYBJADRAFT_165906 [Cyberlindnera jadinii NRRL Y-1542]ODV75153.1 hypothetical protein CYBJADRAFT_165906 [Cyberlindnera jadinii NRRL Y-1542]